MKKKSRTFNVVIERDEGGFYIASVPNLPGCHTQAKSLFTMMPQVNEVIQLCLMEYPAEEAVNEFIGVQRVVVAV